ncbi:MAG: deoxyribose-phosphate aldolase, partial [Eubacterium sp.]
MIDLSKMTKKTLGKVFDYAILPKNSTEQDVRDGCLEAIKWNCNAMYVSSSFWVPVAKEMLEGSDVAAACGINFPFGVGTPAIKAFEIEEAVKFGATNIDMTMNMGAMRSGKWNVIKEELQILKTVSQGNTTKAIIDMAFLTDDEIRKACDLIVDAEINYVKTATGQFEGPTMEQFLIAKKACMGTSVGLKVSGVKFPRPQNAYAFLMAGADLIGTR